MCFYRTKLYKACGHSEFRRFMCNPVPISNTRHQSDLDFDGLVHIKNHLVCGEPPQHVNDLELGVCGHCRKARHPDKGAGRRSAILEKERTRVQPSIQIFVPESDANEVKQGEKSFQQPVIPIFLPESDAKEAELDEKSENVQVPADVIEERRLFKQSVVEAVEECRQLRVEIEKDQAKARSLLDAIGSLSEYRAIRCKSEPSAIISNTEHPTKPRLVNQAPSHAQPEKSDYHALSHSATKVRRGLFEAKGRVRSMIDAFNGKNEVSPVIPRIHHKRMVTSIANTINRQSDAQHPAKPQPPVVPKKTGLTCRPLPLPPYPDPWTLSKPAKLQILSRHQYHRLVPVPEESDSKSLVLANSVTNTVILRRAKAIKVRNLNAFHCPVRQPRFGLKRKVLAPPVPRHSTPPVAVPCSKFADLGRRRVSELEWRFVI